ncbi:hypothetical protein J2Y48_004805 [Mycoplana sp. BE70]|uniref:DUF1254 domain-containing protein n=1 Tax=Mycoplana sp. BE70 TaxID=2817775 RepID=UPI002865677D|nr:DUF1254 domain-containing protein [Mycoplana sp. BE70]MDR6759489.1 hypothetical protein [Mycoplana sp. BE70]
MNITRRAATIGGIGLLASTAVSPANAVDGPLADLVTGSDEFWTAVDAYIYGYPLVTMEMTRRVLTNVEKPEGSKAPMGQLIKLREYPNASFKDVTAPNADTLYTTAFVDVGEEPWVFSFPDMGDRYFLFPMLDGWTNVFQVPGSRTTGEQAQTFAITGPGWSGSLPDGVTEYKSPTAIVWLLGRIYCTGTPEDYAAVHKIQDACKLQPLSTWGKDYTPPAGKVDPSQDMKTAVREQVNRMTAVEYFTLLCDLIKRNPPAEADAAALERFAAIGIVAGEPFDKSKFEPAFEKRVPEIGFAHIMLHFKMSDGDVQNINGWGFTTKTGLYGTNYIQRALVTAIGLGANRPQDAVYPTSLKDGKGVFARSYDGSNDYVLTFKKGQLPPVKGFWSITMYDENYFFVDNPINRYSISARQDLKVNPDGSVDILIQNNSPGANKESNWLPAPNGKFYLMMRLYWPDESDPSILSGSWVIPPAKRMD